jgi:AraC-like DNA-binding protein
VVLAKNSISLLDIFDRKVLPWAQQEDAGRLVVPHPNYTEWLPEEVVVSEKKLRGVRKPVKGRRPYGNSAVTSALWPDDCMVETKMPKLVCVLHGTTDFQMGDALFQCGEGSFILVPSGTPHPDGTCTHLAGDDLQERYCDLLWLQPWGRGLQCKICQSEGARHSNQKAGEDGFVLHEGANQILRMLEIEASEGKGDVRGICRSLLVAFLRIVQRELQTRKVGRDDIRFGDDHHVPRAEGAIEQAQQYIRSHLNKPLTIENVAQQVYMSRTHFSQKFRSETGQTFVEFVTQCRLGEARALLLNTEWSVTRIGHYVGLRSPAYFNQLFLRHEGTTPGEYRRTARKKRSIKR